MKLKKLAALLLAGVMTLGLTACGGGGGETSKEDNVVTVWAWDEAFNIKALNTAKEMYKEVNPDVEIKIENMGQADIIQKLNTSLASGTYEGLPEIVLIEDYRIQGFLTGFQNEFADLSDIASADDFVAYKTGVNQVDGKLYGIPFDSGVTATFYRLDLVKEAGYTEADMQDLTWDKYIEIGQAVKAKTGVSLLTIDPSEVGQIRMMLQSAGTWYTDEDGKVNVANNQALKDAINTYIKIMKSGVAKEAVGWDQLVGAMNNGEVMSNPTGCWISSSIKLAEDQSGLWAVAPFPRMAENADSVNASSCGGAGWYVLQNVGDTDAAKDFLKNTFASNVELMNQLVEDIDLVSTVKAAGNVENYQKEVPFYGGQEVFGDLIEWQNNVPVVNYGANTYRVEDKLEEAVQKILAGEDMQKVLDDYQKQIEAEVK